ncbi:MAG: hypothetical protein IPJ77_08115 [Planctomycetes bacterium]|nr:hypothetical protein [Planctomycetota bacterium]
MDALPPDPTSFVVHALLAAVGTYGLARELARSRPAALAAGVAFVAAFVAAEGARRGGGNPVAPSTPLAATFAFAPWAAWGIERVHASAPWRGRLVAALAGVVAFALATLESDPAPRALAALALAGWAARAPRRPTTWAALAAVGIAWGVSAELAHAGPRAAPRFGHAPVDLVALGLLLVAIALAARWRALVEPAERAPDAERSSAAPPGSSAELRAASPGAWTLGLAGVVVALVAAVALDRARFGDVLVREAFLRGSASAWLVLPAAVLALAWGFAPRRERALAGVGTWTLALAVLALGAGSFDRVLAAVPFLGDARAETVAPFAALGVALCAACALDLAPARARAAAAVLALALAGFVLATGQLPSAAGPRPSELPRVDPDDELVGAPRRPPEELADATLGARDVLVWLHPALKADATLFVEGLERGEGCADARNGVAPVALERVDLFRALDPGPAADGPSPRAPAGAQGFALREGALGPIPPGWWSVRVEFRRAGTDEVLGTRVLGVVRAEGGVADRFGALFVLAASLALLLAAPLGPRTRAAALGLLAAAWCAVPWLVY